MTVETKLRAARTRLILDHPFIGALVLHLPLVEAQWCETVATDARAFYYRPAYVDGLTLAETQFVLAHEAMHCALGHFARRAHRVRPRWDVACDHAVNLLLVDEGFTAPQGALLELRYRGLSAEEIYPLIPPDTAERTLDRHAFDGQDGFGGGSAGRIPGPDDSGSASRRHEPDAAVVADGDDWSDAAPQARRNASLVAPDSQGPATADELDRQWKMRVAAAAHQARHAGRLGASWQRLVEHAIEPKLAWRTLLARYLVASARDDYSFQRAGRRGGDALLPSLQSRQIDVCVVLDTSGSIGERELAEFAAEVEALKGQVSARVTLHACDERLAPGGPWTFEPWQPLVLPDTLEGGGGTDFRPVFEWLADEGMRPDLLVYFTDAEGEFPELPPPFPVVWLVKGAASVPWGERIQLD